MNVNSSAYERYQRHRQAGASPTAAAQLVAHAYGHHGAAEVAEVVEAMTRLEARDGPPAGAPQGQSQPTERSTR